jgi:hypothetical protein
VDLDDGVVEVAQHRTGVGRAAEQVGVLGEVGQEPGGDRVGLADVSEGERAQERSQRRGGVCAGEDPCRRAAAGPCPRCCPRRRPCAPPARTPSAGVGALVRRTVIRSSASSRSPPGRAPSAEPNPPLTGDWARRTTRTPPGGCELHLQDVVLGLVIRTLSKPYLPSSEGHLGFGVPELIGGSRLSAGAPVSPSVPRARHDDEHGMVRSTRLDGDSCGEGRTAERWGSSAARAVVPSGGHAADAYTADGWLGTDMMWS